MGMKNMNVVLLCFVPALLNAQITVRQYGATANWITDDGPAIRAALAATPSGSVVEFPPGTYRITSPITGGGSGIVLKGDGRSATVIRNESNSHAIIVPAKVRGYTVSDLTIEGRPGSLDCIHISDDFAHVRLINLALLPQSGSGVSTYEPTGTAGGIDVYLESVRVYFGTIAFNFLTTTSINDVTLINCYANGASNVGFNLNGVFTATLINTNADTNRIGYNLNAVSASISGATAEGNSVGGFWMVGPGAYTLTNTYTWNQISPYKVTHASADVILLNPRSAGTPSGPALDITSARQVTLIGGKGLDKGLSSAADSFLAVHNGTIRASAF